jgi:hypothetical protein
MGFDRRLPRRVLGGKPSNRGLFKDFIEISRVAELGSNQAKKCTRVAPGIIQRSYRIRIELYQELYGDLSGVVYEVTSGWMDGPIQDRVEAGEGLVWFIRGMRIQESVQGFYRGSEQGRALLGLILGLGCRWASDQAWEEYRI